MGGPAECRLNDSMAHSTAIIKAVLNHNNNKGTRRFAEDKKKVINLPDYNILFLLSARPSDDDNVHHLMLAPRFEAEMHTRTAVHAWPVITGWWYYTTNGGAHKTNHPSHQHTKISMNVVHG